MYRSSASLISRIHMPRHIFALCLVPASLSRGIVSSRRLALKHLLHLSYLVYHSAEIEVGRVYEPNVRTTLTIQCHDVISSLIEERPNEDFPTRVSPVVSYCTVTREASPHMRQSLF